MMKEIFTRLDLKGECLNSIFPKPISAEVQIQQAFRDRLAKPLAKHFGPNSQSVGMYPIPILTRDIPGYSIAPHTDTHWKGITVELYLLPDDSVTHIGTIFL